jgi:hypothetical protein
MLNGSTRALPNSQPIDVAIVDSNGDLVFAAGSAFDPSRPATTVITTVPSSTSSTTLLTANPLRRRVIIWNHSTKALFVAFAATATAAAFSFSLGPGGSYEGPLNDYTGIITGIWNAANGNALVTEITT